MTISRNLSKLGAKADANGAVTPEVGAVTRAMLSPTADGTGARNWTLLGASLPLTANAVRTPTVSWALPFQQLMIEYYIGSYAGAAIARVVFGNTPNTVVTLPGETTATCWCDLTENVPAATATGNTTNSIATVGLAISGIPTAITIGVAERWGMFNVNNQASRNKRITCQGQYSVTSIANLGNPATVAPTSVRHDAIYTAVTGTIQQVSLVSYGDTSTNTVSAVALGTGSYVNVWGRNND